ncbi:MAG: alpha/beta fold hydrolase [Bacteroidota bacterium]
MKLFNRVYGEGKPLIILHGLLGSSDNWVTLAKKYAEQFKVIIPDQRNHGNTEHSEDFSYALMSDDVLELYESEGISSAFMIGHSMGGKVAMNFACDHPKLVEKLIIADIGPKKYPIRHENLFKALLGLELKDYSSRGEIDKKLSESIPNFGERQFLMKNLDRNQDGTFSWKANLEVLFEKLDAIGEELNDSKRFDKSSLFLRGGNSDYILDEDDQKIKQHFPNSSLQTFDKSGHWLHAEQPQLFFDSTMKLLNE